MHVEQNPYGRAWQKARATFLRSHPICAMCTVDGKPTPATVVDHIRPHKGNQALFWDTSNWQPLCRTHHNATKQHNERSGRESGCNAQGVPRDAQHHWNR